MLQPTARIAGSAACRAQMQCVLRLAPTRPGRRQTLPLEASMRTASRSSRALAGAAGTSLTLGLSQCRPFSVSAAAKSKDDERVTTLAAEQQTNDPSASIEGITESSASSTPAMPTSTSDDVPWYLKVDVPKHETLTPKDTPLPDLPANSPSLMQPLLTFVADDLGLDELKVLDLRALDPPAALGPDLLMLFGTARSERHLHVSADRLVRWLRKYGINATADGLLGRNELKIKLRRKARRAKLLGNLSTLAVGADGAPVDDGISTQWVCLHAGTLGRSRAEGHSVDAEGRSSGFGTLRSTGTTVVVQMFTESKRQQMDLETLWSRALARSIKKRAEAGEDVRDLQAALVEDEAKSKEEMAAGEERDAFQSVWKGSTPQPKSKSPTPAQFRWFSTSARRLAGVTSDDVVAQLTQPRLRAADLPQIDRTLSQSSADKVRLLHQLTLYLDSLPPAAVVDALGGEGLPEAERAMQPTSDFAKSALYCMQGLSAADTWAFRAWVHAKALRVGSYDNYAGTAHAYTLAGMGELVSEMQRGGIPVSRELCLHILQSIFAAGSADHGSQLDQQKAIALGLIDTLHERGQSVLATDVVVSMVLGLARGAAAASTAASSPSEVLQTTLETLLRQAALPCPDETQLAQLLDAYATQDDWTRFWAAWRLPVQHGQSRSAGLYVFMYNRMAQTRNQARCIEALRWCFQEMLHEQPLPVAPSGAVLDAIKACINVADPHAAGLARNLVGGGGAGAEGQDGAKMARLANREFVRLLKALEI